MALGARIDAALETIGRLCGFPRWPAWLRRSSYRAMQVVGLLLVGVGGAAVAAKAFLLAASAFTVGLTLLTGASIAIDRRRGGWPDLHPVFDRLPRPIQVAWSYAYLMVGRLMLGAVTRTPLGALLALPGAFTSQEGAAYHRRMRRLRTPRARTLTSVDGRRTVLYLRSFAADEIGTGGFLDAPLTTDEEHIAAALAGIGPLVAIGRPSEPLPELGAARAYFTDDEWQNAVRGALGEAALVVVRAGSTEHLFWEFALAREMRAPSTLIVLVPNATREYDAFAARCAERGIVLPLGRRRSVCSLPRSEASAAS